MLSESNICFVQTAAPGEDGSMHPIHRKMANSVGAEFQTVQRKDLFGSLNGSIISDLFFLEYNIDPDYDVFVFESPSSLYVLPKIINKLNNSRIVYLHTNVRFAGPEVYPMKESPLPIKLLGQANQSLDALILKKIVNRYVDGIITVSDLFARRCSEWYNGEISIVAPFIRENIINELHHSTPNLSTNTVIYLGYNRGHKGVDILTGAWPMVRQNHPNAELRLYGCGHAEKYEEYTGVKVMGYADSLSVAFSSACLFVHPARLDAYAMAPVEAMYTGMPAIVTKKTGSRSAVSQVDEKLVTSASENALANIITWYLGLSTENKKEIGQTAREIALEYEEQNKAHEFKQSLGELV